LTVWGAAVLVLVFLVLQVSPLVNRVEEDESTSVCDAHRLVRGQVPYRDFFSLWAPVGGFVLSGWPTGWGERPETAARYIQVILLLAAFLLLAFRFRCFDGSGSIPAMILPIVLFPMAYFNGNHWLAILLYCGAILAAERLWHDPANKGNWLLLGFLAGTAACTMQTEGTLGALLLLFTVLTTSQNPREAVSRGGRALVGVAGAGVLWLGPLLLLGAGKRFFRDVVWWPLVNYRKPGNIVDMPFLWDLPGSLRAVWALPVGENAALHSVVATAGTLLYVFVLMAFLTACIFSIFHLAVVVFRRRHADPALTTASVLTLLSIGLYARVNPTWVHITYAFTPVFVLLCLVGTPGMSARLRKALRAVLVLVLVCGAVFNCRAYLTRVHHVWEYTDVDRVDRESPLNRSLRSLPFMEKGDTVAVLPAGSKVYLYAYPPAIGYTQLFTLDEGHYDIEDHRRVAKEIAEHLPKLVLMDKINQKGFLSKEDPISSVLKTHYSMWSQSPSVSAYVRKELLRGFIRPTGEPGKTR